MGIQIAIDTFTEFLKNNDIEITLAVFGSENVSISGKMAEDIASFVEDSYVEAALEEYKRERYSVHSCSRMEAPSMMPDYFNPGSFKKKSESLEDVLKEIYTDSFEKYLQQLINKKGLKNSEVYATANISNG